MNVVHIIQTNDPQRCALALGAILAADKGVGNEVRQDGDVWFVIAEDGRAIRCEPVKEAGCTAS